MSGEPARPSLLASIAGDIAELPASPGPLVAVDGVDGAGKTHFADELAEALAARDLLVIRASVDGFHHPAKVRYRRGRDSPEGFFNDSYDYGALRKRLLDPLRDGDRRIVRAVYDVGQEKTVDPEIEIAPLGAVLVLDEIFLHRAELRGYWDYSIFLDVDFTISVPRGARRGYGDPDPDAEANHRYVEGQRLYLVTSHPREHATVVIDNNDIAHARIVRRAPL